MSKTIYDLRKDAKEVYEGLKHSIYNDFNYWYVSKQEGIDYLFEMPASSLKYSSISFNPGIYEVNKVPSDYMGFYPRSITETALLRIGELEIPNDVHISQLCLEGGEMKTSKRNAILQCYISKTIISTAHSIQGIHQGGSIGFSKYPKVDPTYYLFNSCRFTDCQINAFLGTMCALDNVTLGPYFNGNECYDINKKRIIRTSGETTNED